jgi:hypothetical protein
VDYGTLLGLATAMGFVDEEGNFPKSKMAFAADALATMFRSIFGMSPVTSNIESGVEAGSHGGLAPVIRGCYFFLFLSISPDHFQHSALGYRRRAHYCWSSHVSLAWLCQVVRYHTRRNHLSHSGTSPRGRLAEDALDGRTYDHAFASLSLTDSHAIDL